MPEEKKLSRSRALAAKVLYSAFSILRDSGKEMPMRDLMGRVKQDVDLDEWGKVGDVREILTFSWKSSPNNRFESDVKRLAPFHVAQAERSRRLRRRECRVERNLTICSRRKRREQIVRAETAPCAAPPLLLEENGELIDNPFTIENTVNL